MRRRVLHQPLHYWLMSAVSIEIPSWGLAAVLLFAQAALSILTIELLRTRVFTVVHRLDTPELVLDVWTPMALVLPMLFIAGRVEHDIRHAGWMIVGGPIACAVFAAGAALAIGMAVPSGSAAGWIRLTIASAGAALILLLLGAAHDLTLWVGQCAFAIGAVLLWINTPDWKRPHADDLDVAPAREERIAGAAMTIALGCSLFQGLLLLYLPDDLVRIGASLLMAQSAVVLMASGRIAGGAAALRIGGWTAIYGILLGLGVFAVIEMAPQAWRIVHEGRAEPISKVASGFGAFAFEACVLALFAVFCSFAFRKLLKRSAVAGLVVIGLGATLAAYRIARMSM